MLALYLAEILAEKFVLFYWIGNLSFCCLYQLITTRRYEWWEKGLTFSCLSCLCVLELFVVAFLCECVFLSIPEQTQESIQRFEQQAGLREAGYTPHKGLTTEETKYHRVAEAVHVRLVLSWLSLCRLCTSLTPVWWYNSGSMLLGLSLNSLLWRHLLGWCKSNGVFGPWILHHCNWAQTHLY